MRRLAWFLVLLGGVSTAFFFWWTFAPQPEPRVTFGEACWPTGFTKDGRHALTYKRWHREFANGSSGEEATGPIQLWDLRTGIVTASFLDEQTHVNYHAELSPDDRWLAVLTGSATAHEALRIFNVGTGKEHMRLTVPAADATAWHVFHFSTNGKLLAISQRKPKGEDIQILNVEQKQIMLDLQNVQSPFAFAPDGNHIAVTLSQSMQRDATKGEVRLVELEKGEERGRYQSRMGAISIDLAFSPDGRTLCAEGEIGATVWDVITKSEMCWIPGASVPRFVPDGTTLILQAPPGHLLVDTASWRARESVAGHAARVSAEPTLRSNLLAHTLSGKSNHGSILSWFREVKVMETVEVYNAVSGELVLSIPHSKHATPFLTPHPTTLLLRHWPGSGQQTMLEVWDLPPHSPVGFVWPALISVLVAAGIGFVAWRARKSRNRGDSTSTSGLITYS